MEFEKLKTPRVPFPFIVYNLVCICSNYLKIPIKWLIHLFMNVGCKMLT